MHKRHKYFSEIFFIDTVSIIIAKGLKECLFFYKNNESLNTPQKAKEGRISRLKMDVPKAMIILGNKFQNIR
ncbi:hypothetical protein SDC9_93387 [bioreactor metagenome]|uniref:Uncharacterized protein n=1 Tax=bioreactor metagenome TaxID=1076179 RepID=A0A645A0W8_9ZZZZ